MFGEALEQIANIAELNNKFEENDYIKDGLVYCGKCDTPRQVIISWFGDKRKVWCECTCRAEKNRFDDEESKKRRAEAKQKNLLEDCFGYGKKNTMCFENDYSPASDVSKFAREYVSQWEDMRKNGKGIVFFGDVGTGKTFYSCSIAKAIICRYKVPCLVTNFQKIESDLASNPYTKNEYLKSLNRYKVLVIDDFSTERETSYMQEIVYTVINDRIESGLPIIITTNLTGDELKQPKDTMQKRIFSRLYENCLFFEVKGKDKRKQKMIAEANKR